MSGCRDLNTQLIRSADSCQMGGNHDDIELRPARLD